MSHALSLAGKRGQKLPGQLPDSINCSGVQAAYETCLDLEQKAQWSIVAEGSTAEEQNALTGMPAFVCARVLGHAIIVAPSEQGRTILIGEINQCERDEVALARLGRLYVYGLVCAFYNPEASTPAGSHTMSPNAVSTAAEQANPLLAQSQTVVEDMRKLVELRDESRCAFTGTWNLSVEDALERHLPAGEKIGHLELAHIITTNTDGIIPSAMVQRDWATTSAAIIENFGGFSAKQLLGDALLHSPTNGFLAAMDVHRFFDELEIWLMPLEDENGVVVANTYQVCDKHGGGTLKFINGDPRQVITFRQLEKDGKVYVPAPHPKLIALHAACARIAHLSGAADYVKYFFGPEDDDLISVMTELDAPEELDRRLRALQLVAVA